MKITLAFLTASFTTFANGARYGLLRVGTPAAGKRKQATSHQFNMRSLFDEDFQATFRELFGDADMSIPAGLSFSMQLQLSLSMPPYSTPPTAQTITATPTIAPTVSAPPEDETAEPTDAIIATTDSPTASPTATTPAAESQQDIEQQAKVDSSTRAADNEETTDVLSPAEIAVSTIMAVAAVAVVAAVVARKMRKGASSFGSVSDGSSSQSSLGGAGRGIEEGMSRIEL